jgi:putative transposase
LRPVHAHNFGTFFVGAQTAGRRALLQSDQVAKLFLETLQDYRKKAEFELHEFVVMPNHVHLLITPKETLERAMQLIKGGFSHRFGKEITPVAAVWQKGFTDHRIRDWEDYDKHKHYIWMNPVKAGLCEGPEDHPYSSAQGSFELDPVPQRLKLQT